MVPDAERQRANAEYEELCKELAETVGMGPNDKIDDWIKEGLMRTRVVNHNIQGCILKRTSVFTKNRVLRSMIAIFKAGATA